MCIRDRYKTIKILPALIQKLYTGYGLVDQQLTKYPPLGIRKRTAREVRKKVEELIQIFEVANHLSAIGQYDLAATSYHYISKYYQGPEILNNEGIAYALHAINFGDNNVDQYLYPLELDWSTRLIKPGLLEGDRALSPEDRRYRQKFLIKALDTFKKALLLNPHYFTADLNIICVMTLMGNYQQAIDYYTSNQVKFIATNYEQRAKVNMALAIAKAASNDWNLINEAKTTWGQYALSNIPAISCLLYTSDAADE